MTPRSALRITFVLPSPSRVPIGGYGVAYRYACGLSSRGHAVTIVHLPNARGSALHRWSEVAFHRAAMFAQRRSMTPWFELPPAVRLRYHPATPGTLMPRSDITVLTAWQTVRALPTATGRTGPLIQLVWDYERWLTRPDERVAIRQALRRPDVARVAMSSAVAAMLHDLGTTVDHRTSIGIDGDRFTVVRPPEQRQLVVGFAHRPEPHKAMDDLFTAIPLVRRCVPTVHFRCFGEASGAVPAGVDHLGILGEQALVDFYNSCAVFVVPSHAEGLGLPALEAMACGAAVVTTDNGGSRDVCIDGRTAVVIPPRRPDTLATAVVRLVRDTDRRTALARRGAAAVAARSWETATTALEEILVQQLAVHRSRL